MISRMNSDNLYLTFSEVGSSADRMENITTQFLIDLKEVGVDKIERVAGESIPEGVKVVDPFTIGALVIVVAPVVLPKLIEFLQAWVLGGENRRLKIRSSKGVEIEWTPEKHLSKEEIVNLVRELEEISKHSKMG